MFHKQIFEPVLAQFDGEKAAYFFNIANKLEEDPRVEAAPNLVFLVLKDTAPFLPNYLPPKEFINELLAFVFDNNHELSNLIYSPEYIINPGAIRKITAKFVGRILEVIMETCDEQHVSGDKQSVHTVSWPYDEVDFPYSDDEL